jgi:hypothetical protein
MIDIVVIRGEGNIDGGEVVSPLLSEIKAALDRGRQEIEKHTTVRKVSLKTVFRPGVMKGQIVEVADSLQGPIWRGVIMGLSHVAEEGTVFSVLSIERPI